MSGLPTAALHEVAAIERNVIEAAKIKDATAYVGLENIESGGKLVGVREVDGGELASSKFTFTANHLLYGKLRPYLAKIARPQFEGICSTDILPVLPGPKLDRNDLTHFLLQPSMVAFANSRAAGANLPRLSPRTLAEFRVPVPLLAEQQRIAEVLDQADALRAKRRAALAQLDSLTQSIFLNMFGDPVANERGWPSCSVGDFVAGFESGKSIVGADEDSATSPYRVLKVSAVTSLQFRPEQSKAMPPGYEPPEAHKVRAGDLLFSRANTSELIGATAYVAITPPNLLLPDKLWRFVWYQDQRVTPHFVRFLFQHPKFRREIAKRASGTSGSMKNVSQKKVLTIHVGLPPFAVQDEFANRISSIEKLKATHCAALTELDALFASLQHRAFRGEL